MKTSAAASHSDFLRVTRYHVIDQLLTDGDIFPLVLTHMFFSFHPVVPHPFGLFFNPHRELVKPYKQPHKTCVGPTL